MAMAAVEPSGDVRLDLGEGPSSPTLQASIRVRPITIRFTEPGVRDLHFNLYSIASLRPNSVKPANSASESNEQQQQHQQQQQQQQLIFDFDAEQQQTVAPPSPPAAAPAPTSHNEASDANRLIRDVVDSLSADGLMGDETVRALKHRMEQAREGVRGRRLRLIHAGRILRDGVRLAGYLEELDLRTRVQSRQTLRHLVGQNGAGDESEEDSEAEARGRGEGREEEEDDDDDEERDTVEKKELSGREMVGWLEAQAYEVGRSDAIADSSNGASASSRPPDSLDRPKGKGKRREPSWYSDTFRLTVRTAPIVYIQCSVGDVVQPSARSPTNIASDVLIDTTTTTTTTGSLAPADHLDDADADAEADTGSDRNRGFNRLLEAGLTADEVSTMRTQFRSAHPLPTAYDLIQAREHQQHLLQMEEAWMDTFTSSAGGEFGDAPATAGTYTTAMHGLMLGFFVPPLIPLFWFRDQPHPSSLPAAQLDAGDEQEDEDDEQRWEAERSALTRESVFGSTMQISILFGLVANLIVGVFRFIW